MSAGKPFNNRGQLVLKSFALFLTVTPYVESVATFCLTMREVCCGNRRLTLSSYPRQENYLCPGLLDQFEFPLTADKDFDQGRSVLIVAFDDLVVRSSDFGLFQTKLH